MSDSLVIIPTYNERENIEKIISRISSLEKKYDILVVDDASPDGTQGIILSLQKKNKRIFLLKRNAKLGLGTAYIDGFRWGLKKNYEYFFEMDADFSHNPDDLIRLYNACEIDGYDLSIGSRYLGGLVNVINWPIMRVLMSYFASRYVKIITGLPIDDATAGFKCYKRNLIITILNSKISFIGYAFQIEMKFKAWKYGFKIKEIPVIFKDRSNGVSKMSTSIFYEAFFGVIYLKLASFFKSYKR